MVAKRRYIFDDTNMKQYAEWAKEELYENGYVDYDEELADDDDRVLERIWEMQEMDIQEMGGYLEDLIGDNKVLVQSSIRSWFKVFDDMRDAFDFICDGCDNVQVYDENGHLFIVGINYGSTNCGEIKIHTKDGDELPRLAELKYGLPAEEWEDK